MPVYYASRPATSTTERQKVGFCANPLEFCVVSMKDVIAGAVPRDLIVGRTVFVGFHSVSAVPDDYPVPNSVGRKMFGVEIWANTAQSIFTNRYPVLEQGFITTLAQLLLVTLGGMLLVVRWRLWGFLAALGVLVLYIAGASRSVSSPASRSTATALRVRDSGRGPRLARWRARSTVRSPRRKIGGADGVRRDSARTRATSSANTNGLPR